MMMMMVVVLSYICSGPNTVLIATAVTIACVTNVVTVSGVLKIVRRGTISEVDRGHQEENNGSSDVKTEYLWGFAVVVQQKR